jgi:hypothetical protein
MKLQTIFLIFVLGIIVKADIIEMNNDNQQLENSTIIVSVKTYASGATRNFTLSVDATVLDLKNSIYARYGKDF